MHSIGDIIDRLTEIHDANEKIVKAAKALLPHLPTEGDLLDNASLNEGRASEFDRLSVALRRAVTEAENA